MSAVPGPILYSLEELIAHFFYLFGLRNSAFLHSLKNRISFLGTSITDLQRAFRKEASKDDIGLALARIVSRIFCIAEFYRGHMSLPTAMAKKYPAQRCSYCNMYPCTCDISAGREEPTTTVGDVIKTNHQLEIWSLQDWQKHFDDVYGRRNRTQNIEQLLAHLLEEKQELDNALTLIPSSALTAEGVIESIAFELADVLAWTCAIATQMGINLHEVLMARYYPTCPSCQTAPCACRTFNHEQLQWAKPAK